MPRSFRLSEKALANLKKYSKEKKLNVSRALNLLLEELQASNRQKEHLEKGNFLQLPPFFHCQDKEAWIPREELYCSTCRSKEWCSAWKG